MSAQEHKAISAEKEASVKLAIVTSSDTRTPETDKNYHYLKAEIERAGHQLVGYQIVKDEADLLDAALEEMVAGDAQMVLFNGGTGVSPRDTTFDVINRKLEKTLPGFGELFRMLSWDQVGSAAMMSRATAGIYKNTAIISTPGSHKAVQLAWEKLILPELQHLAWEITR